jgi:hypothetical protein
MWRTSRSLKPGSRTNLTECRNFGHRQDYDNPTQRACAITFGFGNFSQGARGLFVLKKLADQVRCGFQCDTSMAHVLDASELKEMAGSLNGRPRNSPFLLFGAAWPISFFALKRSLAASGNDTPEVLPFEPSECPLQGPQERN